MRATHISTLLLAATASLLVSGCSADDDKKDGLPVVVENNQQGDTGTNDPDMGSDAANNVDNNTTNNANNTSNNANNTSNNATNNGAGCGQACSFPGPWRVLSGALTDTTAMWGCRADEVWISAAGLSRFNGVDVQTAPEIPVRNFLDVSGSSCDNVWFVSTTRVYRWNGATLAQVDIPFTNARLNSVWVASDTVTYVAATDSNQIRLYKYDGAWSPVALPAGIDNIRLADRASKPTIVSASKVYVLDGDTWTEIDLPGDTVGQVAEVNGTLWVAGTNQLYSHDGTSWTTWPTPLNRAMVRMAIGPDGTVWAVSSTDLLKFNGFELTKVAAIPNAPFDGRADLVASAVWPVDASRVQVAFEGLNERVLTTYDATTDTWETDAHQPFIFTLHDDGQGLLGADPDGTTWRISATGITPFDTADPWERYLGFNDRIDGAEGVTWVAGTGGLHRITANGVAQTIAASSGAVEDLAAATADSAWVALEPNRFAHLTAAGLGQPITVTGATYVVSMWAASIDDVYMIVVEPGATRALYNYLDEVSMVAERVDVPVSQPWQIEGNDYADVWVLGEEGLANFTGVTWTAHPLAKKGVTLAVGTEIVAVTHDDNTLSIRKDGAWSNITPPEGVAKIMEIEAAGATVWVTNDAGQVWQFTP